jgi:hypothetical protein
VGIAGDPACDLLAISGDDLADFVEATDINVDETLSRALEAEAVHSKTIDIEDQ